MAGTAYKAAPAMAIAGVLVVAPQAHASTAHTGSRAATVIEQANTAQANTAQVHTEQVHTDALVTHHEETRRYTVRAGDTLSSIAQRFYGRSADWNWLYQANKSVIKNANMIYPGEVLTVPFESPASSSTATTTTTAVETTSAALSGTLGCPQLEDLWEEAGGSAGQAVTAASIAMAESGGQEFATGSAGERGYWQINPDHGSLSTYDPLGNAKAAVAISGDGTDWAPWTTFTSGAYLGRC